MNTPIGSLAPSLLSGNGSIQRLKELRPVGRGKWRWASGDFAGRTDMLHERSLRESQTDRVLRKGATTGRHCMRVLGQYAPGQRYIVGDDHVSSNHLLGDPIVGDVRSRTHDYPCDQRRWRNLNKTVGYNQRLQPIASGDFVGFLLYGACVSIDVDLDRHGRVLTDWAAFVAPLGRLVRRNSRRTAAASRRSRLSGRTRAHARLDARVIAR